MTSTRVRDMAASAALVGTEKFYADNGAIDTNVTSNQLKTFIRPQPHDYIDIRDYGTVVDGGNITAAVTAAFLSGEPIRRFRIPWLGSLGFIFDPTGLNMFTKIIEIDAELIQLLATWDLSNNMRIMGRSTTSSSSLLNSPAPRPIIRAHSSVNIDPVMQVLSNSNFWIENVEVTGDTGEALRIDGCSLFTIKNCEFNATAASAPLVIDQSFWGCIEHVQCTPRAAGDQFAIEITNATDFGPGNGTDCGLLRFKDIRCISNGILISAEFGPTGTNNIIFDDVISEDFVNGTALFTFDSLGTVVGNITITVAEIADALGTSYVLRNLNTGNTTQSVSYTGVKTERLIDPASDPIKWFTANWRTDALTSTAGAQNLHALWPGTQEQSHVAVHYPAAADTKLLASPIGVPWVFGTPLNVIQNPSGWGGSVTTGQLGPDGSTNAGLNLAASTVTFFTGSVTLNVGDYLVAGVWVKLDTTTAFSLTGLKIFVGAGNDYDGSAQEAPWVEEDAMEDKVSGMGWRWLCKALKMTTATGAASTVTFSSFNGRVYFNPCMVHIPAANGLTDVWVLNYVRSLRGGWSSKALAGDVGFLDHQRVQAGGFNLIDGVTAPATQSGVAQIYVDTADGDLKVKFGDGTVKTIVVDT